MVFYYHIIQRILFLDADDTYIVFSQAYVNRLRNILGELLNWSAKNKRIINYKETTLREFFNSYFKFLW